VASQAPATPAQPRPIKGLTAGRMVHFVFERPLPVRGDDGIADESQPPTGFELVHRPAIVVDVVDAVAGTVELTWFPAMADHASQIARVYDCPFSERPTKGTWHYIEAVP
jgi:hypothetical protein